MGDVVDVWFLDIGLRYYVWKFCRVKNFFGKVKMKVIIIDGVGGFEVLKFIEVFDFKVGEGEVVIKFVVVVFNWVDVM